MAYQHQNTLLIDSLYCSENHLEEEDLEEQVVEQEKHDYITTKTHSPLLLLEQDLFWDNEELTSLLAKENVNKLNSCLQSDTNIALARREAVEWILKVNAHFSFSAQTSVLAVNYFDRFIFSFRFQINGKPWFTQLAAVTCLSLAAKMEETYVPHSIDLQVVERTRYLFEGKTIKRMEILILSTLEWKMNPVTAISFLDYITRRIGLKGYLCLEFLRRCEAVLLSIFTDCRFLSYLPSVLATSIMMLVVTSVEPCLGVEYQNQLLGIIGFNKEKVEECYKLILEVVTSYDHNNKEKESKLKKRKLIESFPNSPNGVMEGIFSCECDSFNECWELDAFVSYSKDQTLSKKNRTQDQLLLNNY